MSDQAKAANAKPAMAIRFSDMSALDDDDLDLFTVSNYRAKPGASGVVAPAPAPAKPAQRPSNLHDNRKDGSASKSIFDDIKDKFPDTLAVISRKLEELTPEEKFRDVKTFLRETPSRRASEHDSFLKALESSKNLDEFDVKINDQQRPVIEIHIDSVDTDVESTRKLSTISLDSKKMMYFDDVGDRHRSASVDSAKRKVKTDVAPVKHATPCESSKNSAENKRFSSPPPIAKSKEPPGPVLASIDPLNAILQELNEQVPDTDSDVDEPVLAATSQPVVVADMSKTAMSRPVAVADVPKTAGFANRAVEISGELSDDDFEPMEDFFGTARVALRNTAATKVSPSNLRKDSFTSQEPRMSFNALKQPGSDEILQTIKKLDTTAASPSVERSKQQNLSDYSPVDGAKQTLCEKPEPIHAPTETTDIVVAESSRSVTAVLLQFWKLGAILVVLLAYVAIPLPSYLAGLITGALLSGSVLTLYIFLTKPPKEKSPFSVSELNSLPPFLIPEIRDCRLDEGIFKGWMNELSKYDATNYHINDTSSVFVRLEGSALRLQRPKQPVPKRALWNELLSAPKFIHQRHYNVNGAKVKLLPGELVKKRLWSKKYPICITMKQLGRQDDDKAERTKTSAIPSRDDNCDFEYVTKDQCVLTLYLFARTCREKEEWYRRFVAAARGVPLVNHLPELCKLTYASAAEVSFQNVDELISTMAELREDFKDGDKKRMIDYARFMAKFMPAEHMVKALGCSHKDLARLGHVICDSQLIWLNALIGRVLWDLLREKFWAHKVYERIQKKLSKIHVPIFINEVKITDLELGNEVPVIRRASKPYLDARGLWIDLDIAYGGGFRMTIETKCNLMKLKKDQQHHHSMRHREERMDSSGLKPATLNSEEEDSVESSSESEEELPVETDTTGERAGGGGGGKKFMRIVDKITNSKYFQQATEIKYIRRAMEGVSNTPLVLSVEVHSLVGTLAVNIPAPPTDRLWYGFRTNPRLVISARPKVGDREVTVTHVTDWIEKKLESEFQKVLVLPNMDDVPILVMNQGVVSNSSSGAA